MTINKKAILAYVKVLTFLFSVIACDTESSRPEPHGLSMASSTRGFS